MDAASPSPRPTRSQRARTNAFSLVEVTLALGIVVCALLPLVGLLSVSLNSYQNSNARGPAAQAINQIASSIRSATLNNGIYTATPPFGSVSWKTDGTTTVTSYNFYFYDNGQVATTPNPGKPSQLVAKLVLKAPNRNGTNFAPGTAQIAIAWPGLGAPSYTPGSPATNIGTVSFVNPQGHEETTISFVPN